jgi:hypothetical protein
LSYVFLGMRRTIAKSTWAEIRTAYASGVGLREIARNMGIPAGTVLARAKREGWTQWSRQVKALAKREDTSSAVTPFEAVSASIQQRGERHVGRVANIVEKTLPHVEAMEPGAILDRIDDVDKLDRIGRRAFGLDEGQPIGVQLNVLNISGSMIEPS